MAQTERTKRSWSRQEWNRSLNALSKPTDDDVSITKDGRRLDAPEKILAWVAELNAERQRVTDDDRVGTR